MTQEQRKNNEKAIELIKQLGAKGALAETRMVANDPAWSDERRARFAAFAEEIERLTAPPLVEVVNLTPHPITVGEKTFSPSGKVARVAMDETDSGEMVAGIPVITREMGEVTGLLAERENTIFLVSAMVLAEVHGREDVFAPDTGPTAVRDFEGRIQGVTRLVGTSIFRIVSGNRARDAARDRQWAAENKHDCQRTAASERPAGFWRDRRR